MKINLSTMTSSLQPFNVESLFKFINLLITVLPKIYIKPVHIKDRSGINPPSGGKNLYN